LQSGRLPSEYRLWRSDFEKKQVGHPVGDWFPPQEQEGEVDRETYYKKIAWLT
jgi:hypothetical protein